GCLYKLARSSSSRRTRPAGESAIVAPSSTASPIDSNNLKSSLEKTRSDGSFSARSTLISRGLSEAFGLRSIVVPQIDRPTVRRKDAAGCSTLNCPLLDSPPFSTVKVLTGEQMPAKQNRKATAPKARRRTGGKKASAVFDTEGFLTTVGSGRSIATYKAKSYVFRQGAECDAVFYILTGHVDLSVVSKQGKE